MQTKRKLILGFLLAGFGLLAACGNNPGDNNGNDKKVAEGGDCTAEKKCDDGLKCFKKAAGQTGGTCQKPCDTSNPNACGTDHSKMCMEHELLDGNKDHMCMAPAGPPKTWHSECEISSDPHEMAHACHPLHEKPEGAVCVKLKPSAHATCEKLCENGSPAKCATDENDKKLYECETIDTKEVCVAIDKQVNAVCKKNEPGTCQTSGPELVCVTQGAVSTCEKKCDPTGNLTGCDDTEECNAVDGEHICQPIPVKNVGETCHDGDKNTCYNPTVTLACVTQNSKGTCQKVCTDQGDECDPETQLCGTGTPKICMPRPIKQIDDACTRGEPGTCYNPGLMLKCTANGAGNACKRYDACGSASVFEKLKDAVPAIFHKDPTSVLSEPITDSETDGIKELSFNSGAISGPTYTQTKSAMYLDLDTGQAVAITDEQAFNVNTDWDVAFRSYEFYVNGGLFKGDLSIAKVEGSEQDFKNTTVASLTTMSPTQFKMGAELDVANSCSYQSYQYGPFSFPLSAPAVANGNATWCDYNFPGGHQPAAIPGVYYILKNSTDTWFAKLRIVAIGRESASSVKTRFTIQYKVLQ